MNVEVQAGVSVILERIRVGAFRSRAGLCHRRELSNVLEGSVRLADGRLRVTVRLVDVKNGFQLWSETYSRWMKDVFAIQEEIARNVVNSLQVTLAGEEKTAAVATRLRCQCNG